MKYDSIEVGQVLENTLGLEFQILDKKMIPSYKDNQPRTHFLVRFLVSGYQRWAYITNVKRGTVKDRYHRGIHGVACIGDATSKDNQKEYFLWQNMLSRCYSDNFIGKVSYKEKGITVCDRWLVFSNFLNDVYKLDGYNPELFNAGLLELDKDIKQEGVTSKVYSPNTCCFLSKEENLKNRNISHHEDKKRTIVAISPEGEEVRFFGIKAFCKEYGLNNGVLSKVINGKQDNHKGWTVKEVI